MKHLPWAIFLAAALIYGFRTYRSMKSPVPLVLTDEHGHQQLNPAVFDGIVKKYYHQDLARNLFTYIVFSMPESGCPGDFAELPAWIGPRDQYHDGYYDVLVIASDSMKEPLHHFAEKGLLASENLKFFKPGDPQSQLAQFGMLEILYSQEDGVLFYDMGNERPFSAVSALLEHPVR